MKFLGHAHRSLDDKGRLILPPSFRDQILSAVPDGRIILTLGESHVIGISPDQWAELEKKIEGLTAPTRAQRNRIRVLYSGYEEVSVAKNGRVSIPQHLRKSGRLDGEVVLAGVGKRFEIWDKAEFEGLLAQTEADEDDDFGLPF